MFFKLMICLFLLFCSVLLLEAQNKTIDIVFKDEILDYVRFVKKDQASLSNYMVFFVVVEKEKSKNLKLDLGYILQKTDPLPRNANKYFVVGQDTVVIEINKQNVRLKTKKMSSEIIYNVKKKLYNNSNASDIMTYRCLKRIVIISDKGVFRYNYSH